MPQNTRCALSPTTNFSRNIKFGVYIILPVMIVCLGVVISSFLLISINEEVYIIIAH